jgi:hypothetical protein
MSMKLWKKVSILAVCLVGVAYAAAVDQGFNAFVASLSAAGTITGTETFPLVQSAVTKAATPAQIKTYLNGQANTWTAAQTMSGGASIAKITNTSGQLDAVRVITAAGAITVSATDRHVCVNKTTGAASAVALPAGVTGTVFTIDDCKGDAVTNPITISPAAGTIDGSATFVISTAYGSWTGIYTGSIWKTEVSR